MSRPCGEVRQCPALFVSAAASGQGKTTVAAALARLLRRQGKKVRIFKTGPDYLDPQILEQASGCPVVPMDLWMAGDAWCQQQFYLAAETADFILVEGAMGLFDGAPSSADLAARFNIPLALVLDVKGMAQTAAAIAAGLANFRRDVSVLGLIANKCASDRHRQLIEDALPDNVPMLACLARSEDIALPERHLGLVQADEIALNLEQRFERGADALAQGGGACLGQKILPVSFSPAKLDPPEKQLAGKSIGVAKDQAFSFIYAANIALLSALGARIEYFSPLRDHSLPAVDALWLPGGYPELHAKALATNAGMKAQLTKFWLSDRPMLAECGGFLYCLDRLNDLNNNSHAMLGLIAGQGAMRGKRGCQGMQTADLPEGAVRGHAHHRARSENTPAALGYGIRQRHAAPGEAIYRQRGLTASFLHLFFPSNPGAVAQLFLGTAGLSQG